METNDNQDRLSKNQLSEKEALLKSLFHQEELHAAPSREQDKDAELFLEQVLLKVQHERKRTNLQQILPMAVGSAIGLFIVVISVLPRLSEIVRLFVSTFEAKLQPYLSEVFHLREIFPAGLLEQLTGSNLTILLLAVILAAGLPALSEKFSN